MSYANFDLNPYLLEKQTDRNYMMDYFIMDFESYVCLVSKA